MNDLLLAVFLFLLFFVFYSLIFGRSSQENIIQVKDREIAELKQQCLRLKTELETRSQQVSDDLKQDFFNQLQSLLANYPTAIKMAQQKPDLPAKNLVALFTPLGNLLSDWGYETIGELWQQVEYNPQLHQADSDDLNAGDRVYVRFVGYRDRDTILCPAKVSRTLPPGINDEE
jgi:molecular chaperone GrpE (heat shock protein)